MPNKPVDGTGFEKQKKKTVEGAKSYIKYSGIAIQMIVILLAGYYGGNYLDEYFQTTAPYYTGACTLIGVGLALYLPLRNL